MENGKGKSRRRVCNKVGKPCRLRWQELLQHFWVEVELVPAESSPAGVNQGAGTHVGMNREEPGSVPGTLTLHLQFCLKVLPDHVLE